VEVTGTRKAGMLACKPFIFDLVFNSFETIEHNLNKIKRQKDPPDIYIEPNLVDIGMFDFHKTSEVFSQAEPSRELLREALIKLL